MKTRKRSVLLVVLIGLAILLPTLALARPGGGQTYGGGGGGGGYGGGGGGGGDGAILIDLLILLIFEFPQVGIPLALVLGVGFMVAGLFKRRWRDWDSSDGGLGFDPGPVQRAAKATLVSLRSIDPDFSIVLFDDFVYRLYATAHEARAVPSKMDELAPFLSPDVREALMARQPAGVPISNVVVGAMRVLDVLIPNPAAPPSETNRHPVTGEVEVEVELEWEANVTAGAGESAQGYYVWERWRLRRPVSVTTKEPARARSLACPNCGAPFRTADMQRCEYCSEVVTDGRFSWRVVGVRELRSQVKPPALTGDIAEAGTHLATIRAPQLQETWAALVNGDPTLGPGVLEQRVELIYHQLNAAWVARDLRPARVLLSDGIADYLRYWIDAYLREGLINKLEDMRITKLELANVRRDRWYDAVTFRVFASGHDYTVRASDGQRVSGRATRERVYSEYWTLIRGTGVRGAPRGDLDCPNCGAPLAISMGGTCDHCAAHVSAGEFDWVLSKIEQDEVYGG